MKWGVKMYDDNQRDFGELKGKILIEIIGGIGDDTIIFKTIDGNQYKLYHDQECCESVDVVDIAGDIKDLIGNPILMAEVVTHEGNNPNGVEIPEYQESFTWTFYKLATIKGFVTIRWYGESNGYYSELVDFALV